MSNPIFCCQNTHQSAADLVYAKQKKKMNSWKLCRTIFNTDILHVVIEKKNRNFASVFQFWENRPLQGIKEQEASHEVTERFGTGFQRTQSRNSSMT